jgi:N,N-dimethylformamidase
VYCAHVSNDKDEDFIPFVVRAPRGAPTSKLLFLMPTATYMAYGNEHLTTDAPAGELLMTKVTVLQRHDMFLASHREYGGSLYDTHSDYSGVAYSSRLRPLLNMRPKVQSLLGGTGSAVWGLNADTHITHFLEASGEPFDVMTDEDLHYEGSGALEGYRCVVTGTHPEYYSKPMLDALERFKQQGGRLMYLGGNGFYWRVAYHPTAPGIIELRRAEAGIRSWTAATGEYYHSFTGEYGGLWQRNARPPQSVVGVGTTAQGFDCSTYYRRTPQSHDPRAAFIFAGVDEEVIGDFGLVGGGAAGLEIDRADAMFGTPRHALIVAASEGHSDAFLMVPEDIYVVTLDMGGKENPHVHADMVFFETPHGGAVFSVGSIAWAGSLSHRNFDNTVARITRNVIKRFLDEAPFPAIEE